VLRHVNIDEETKKTQYLNCCLLYDALMNISTQIMQDVDQQDQCVSSQAAAATQRRLHVLHVVPTTGYLNTLPVTSASRGLLIRTVTKDGVG